MFLLTKKMIADMIARVKTLASVFIDTKKVL